MPIKIANPRKTAARQPASKKSGKASGAPRKKSADDESLVNAAGRALAGGMRGVGGAALNFAGASGMTDMLRNVGKAVLVNQIKRSVPGAAALEPGLLKVGSALRECREQAGLTMEDLAAAVDLKDPALLEVAEQGKAGLPFEIVLRIASVIGRNDPLPVLMNLTRTAYPQVWEKLEALGVGKLLMNSTREREFLNILRSHDEARVLNDAEFAELLAFVKAAFEMGLNFHARAAVGDT